MLLDLIQNPNDIKKIPPQSLLDNPAAMESFILANTVDGSGITPEEYAEGVKGVTKEDVQAVARSIVPDLFYLLKGGDSEEDEAEEDEEDEGENEEEANELHD